MAIYYHGSPFLFDQFQLTGAGDGTGIKFGYGVYLTESEASAVHYSQPRKQELAHKHYLYTVEIPDLKDGEYLVSAKQVDESIVSAVESKLGVKAPDAVKAAGKEFRKWIGKTLAGTKKAGFAEEKMAAEFLESIGVHYNVWPQAQSKPDGLKNIAVFDASRVQIVKTEEIEVELKGSKWVLKSRKDASVDDVPENHEGLEELASLLADLVFKEFEEEAAKQEEEAKRVAARMAELDEETLRKFNIVREFVSKHDDFWAAFEDCDAVYRPFFHAENPMRFWFNPPFNEDGESYPAESDKLILTKTGEIHVEDHGDGEFYNILDCVGDTLDNAVYAIETHEES